MLKIFLESYKKSLPPVYNKLIKSLETHPNLILHHPIIATPAFHPLQIRLKTPPQSNPIPKGRSILWLSATQSFSSQQLIGASAKDRIQVNNFLNQSSQKYDILKSEQLKGLFRILIQIYANESQIRSGQMPLHYFSNLLMNQINQDQNTSNSTLNRLGVVLDIKKYQKYIKSHHLKNILKSNEDIINKLYQILCSSFIKITNQSQFRRLIKLTRAQLRQVNQHSIILKQNKSKQNNQILNINSLAPILPSLAYSFNPNCVIVGKYFTHLRQSFYCLESLRQIKPGEQLSILYKKSMNNYDKLIRLGYKSIIQDPNNLNNQYLLIINLIDPQIPQVQQIMSGDIDLKKDILTKFQLKMKNLVRITNNGEIKKQDLKMLRILFGVVDDKQIQSQKIDLDNKIYNFIKKFVQPSLQMHRNQKKVQIDGSKDQGVNPQIIKSFRVIEDGQIQILQRFIQRLKSKSNLK